jgi:hypothetical protein
MQTMKTLRKEDMDKAAWSWADTTEPKDVTKEHLDLSYRIKISVCGPNSCRYEYIIVLDKKAVLDFVFFHSQVNYTV